MVLVLCIVMSAYFIRGITGFGSGLIAVPLLALSQPLQFAVPLVLALDFTASLVLGGANRKKVDWAEIKILLPFGMIGACIGAYALLTLPDRAGAADARRVHDVLRLSQHLRPAAGGAAVARLGDSRGHSPAAAPVRCSARARRPTSCT